MIEDNVIYVGNKPIMNYVLAVITQFDKGASEVVIKARGRAISIAVDVAEIVRKRFLEDVEVKDVKIDTEIVKTENGEKGISSIKIYLSR